MAGLDKLLLKMVESGASDLHLSSGEPVRMRIDGELKRVADKPLESKRLRTLMKEICSTSLWEQYVQNNDLDFAYGLKGVSRYRCNYFMHLYGPAAVFRRIPEKIVPLESLGLPSVVDKLTKLKRGLVLMTGPTGSGKSTTLAAIIDRMNRTRSLHIITIEDPIEFVHRSDKSVIVQREVGHHAPTFSRALFDALSQDPDVILVGELRDAETMQLAISAAEMGILVLGTLHTNSASKTIDRLVDSFPANQREQIRGMLSESVRAVVAQQLLKRVDTRGRIAAIEVLLDGPGLPNIIREGNATKLLSYIEAGKGRGMQLLDEALLHLVFRKAVSKEDAYLKATDKQRFVAALQAEGISFQAE
ncbi:MAG: PilT/PilU family type 4a pilus ATPase [Deltaproteobacteria bacterium]|nr:PilT/PilU family type 4a pilus ATPase [Deltaproteobacteria bacterium]MBN2670859.1 PilT/PilU family type 4a pilus ATPase [Deltaproteobacteria bacterium]